MPIGEPKHRILVVEDEAIISMLLEDMVLDAGGEIVGPVAKFDIALAVAREAEFTVAVLDVNLNGTLSYPIADVILERGIPVIFATGYGVDGLLDRFRDCLTLQKPFSQKDFAEAIAASCGFSIAGEEG
jgi:Response regulator containing CheY-like receiver, AAA-type ATPase, and DNA-binding domains